MGASCRTGSSGAAAYPPRHARTRFVLSGVLALLVLVALPAVVEGAEVPQPFWTRCASNSEADIQCNIPRGIASAPATAPTRGNIYVADQANRRVVELTVWGDFVRAWGRDVVESGPGNTGIEFEICVRADGDVCKGGSAGTGAGQFQSTSPQGVAVDSAGNVYVVDRGLPSNQRVQKFDPEGHFVVMWGKGVNETSGGNVCPRPGFPGDVCKVGGIGTGPGEFGTLSTAGDYIEVDTQGTASVLDDEVCVGEVERIQCFDTEGTYLNEIELQAGETARALAIDPVGDRYVSFCGANCAAGTAAKPNVVRKLSPAGVELDTVEVADPRGLATDSSSALYALDGSSNPTIRKYSAAGVEVIEEGTIFPFFPTYPFVPGFTASTGIATGDGCLTAPAYDLYASNAAGPPNGIVRAYGPAPDQLHIEEFPSCRLPKPPAIEDQGAVSVGVDQAAVQATINPRSWSNTSYHVQFAAATCVEESGWEAPCVEEKPVPDALLGAGAVSDGVKTAPVVLPGLAPETKYLYRFVAQSRFDSEGNEVNEHGGPVFGVDGDEDAPGEDGSFITRSTPPSPFKGCNNDALRIGAAAFLPDCRAYEMVTPVDKNGGDIRPTRGDAYIQATSDGGRIAYSAIPAFAGPPSNMIYNQYLAERVPGEQGVPSHWENQGVNAPVGRLLTIGTVIYGVGREAGVFSEDLCDEFLINSNYTPISPLAPQGYRNLYRQDLCGNGGLEPLVRAAPLNGDAVQYLRRDSPQGFAADLSEIAFWAEAELEVAPGAVPPAKATTAKQIYGYRPASGTLHLLSVTPSGDAVVGGSEVGGGLDGYLRHAVSVDGKRIYWTAQISGGTGGLYLRANPDREQSELSGGVCVEPAKACTFAVSAGNGATFWTASPDGAIALYSEGSILYRYDAQSGASTPVVEGLIGVLGASEDLSRIYYVSSKDLTPGEENSEGAEAQEGKPNLYLDEEGSRTFVATLVDGDVSSPLAYSIGARKSRLNTSRVTPDGNHLVFQSRAALTGFDNVDVATGERAVEVFAYDAGGDLHCASCDASGERPRAREVPEAFQYPQLSEPTGVHAAAWIPGWEHAFRASRVLSDDGTRLFFNSHTSLVARDTNNVQDVYEWEAPGAGSCKDEEDPHFHEANDGCVYLITSGKSPFESEFWDASANGRDVFFTTEAGLLPQDPGNIDLYDARVDGGFPQSLDETECEGEACAGPPAPPGDSTPPSQIFEGPGNVIQGASGCDGLARQAAKLRKQAARQRSRVVAQRLAAKAERKSRAAKRCRRARKGVRSR